MNEEIKHRLELAEGTVCNICYKPFTTDNVFTIEGAREIEISGFCEKCFDALFEDEE